MEFDFLEPLSQEFLNYVLGLSAQNLGSKIVLHTNEAMPDLGKIDIAIIGVLENRGDKIGNVEVDLNAIRKELYGMFPGNWNVTIGDLGDILPGNSKEDTFFAVKKIASSLIKRKIIPMVIGGSQDLTYALYRGYDDLEQMVNLVSIDSRFDFGKENETISSDSFFNQNYY